VNEHTSLRDVMEILAERLREGKERNALTIRSIHTYYEVSVDSEPTVKFRWNIESGAWEYCPARMYPYTTMVLEPIEILVRLPIDDALKVPHHPHLTNLEHPQLAIRMEKSVSRMADMLRRLGPPRCIENLKKALETNAKRQNQFSQPSPHQTPYILEKTTKKQVK